MEGGTYRRREPEKSLLYRVVQENLATFLEAAPDLPGHVTRAFHRYLDCGILAKGFVRYRCSDCGHNRLVAFS